VFWQRYHLKLGMIYVLPHHQTAHQWSVNNFLSRILGTQCIAQIVELITKQLTTVLGKYITLERKNTDSKIIGITNWTTSKARLLAAEYLMLIIYDYQTTKIRAVYESSDGPAGQPADNPANSDWLGDRH
jgi:hypothetical protein